jgi:hypothetical protein
MLYCFNFLFFCLMIFINLLRKPAVDTATKVNAVFNPDVPDDEDRLRNVVFSFRRPLDAAVRTRRPNCVLILLHITVFHKQLNSPC